MVLKGGAAVGVTAVATTAVSGPKREPNEAPTVGNKREPNEAPTEAPTTTIFITKLQWLYLYLQL